MFNLLKSVFTRTSDPSDADLLVEEFARQEGRFYSVDLKSFTAGVKFQNGTPELQRAVVMAMLAWVEHSPPAPLNQTNRKDWETRLKMRYVLLQMLRRKFPFTQQDVLDLLKWCQKQAGDSAYSFYQVVPPIIKVVDDYLKNQPVSTELAESVQNLISLIRVERVSAETSRWILRLKELIGDTEISLPLAAGDVWTDAALEEFQQLETGKQSAWAELLLHCLRASGSTPSTKWIKDADKRISAIDEAAFFAALLRWLPLVEKPRASLANRYGHPESLLPVNTDILKGLVWLCARSSKPEVARALSALAVTTYKKIPGVGPRASKVGNACVWALGNMPGEDGVAQLSLLKTKIKVGSAQKLIVSALQTAAKRTGISAEELEEKVVPIYGLQEVGLRRDSFGEVNSELRINGSDVEQVWLRNDGKRLASAPKAVKEQHSDDLKEIAQVVKDIRKMLPAQRDRIDNLYLQQKKWTLSAWQVHYLDHPLVGTIARRLIWKFSKDDKAASAIWFDGNMVGRDDEPLVWLDESTTVELWHPIHAETGVVLEWREWLLKHEIRQPFKQAYREVYLLTDAERNTRVYSNRYSAHILRQHQFNSLCAARGWKNSLRLMVDDELPPAIKILPQWNLRAEYWIEGIGDQYGVDTNETGTFLYLTTDQVRFYRINAAPNSAHAAGGGYSSRRWHGTGEAEPLSLEEIPHLVFSEIMRDVDMFVGVASVGNDPNWSDGGPQVRYRDYWHGYSFGELTESARTRKQVLETLLPRLKIATRCKLTDKFLIVSGDIRTYKIHLGSGNILMEPNDQYLCIVPARGMGIDREKLFIPFEGDQTLSIILSKAFLLAEDKRITDMTITRQLKK